MARTIEFNKSISPDIQARFNSLAQVDPIGANALAVQYNEGKIVSNSEFDSAIVAKLAKYQNVTSIKEGARFAGAPAVRLSSHSPRLSPIEMAIEAHLLKAAHVAVNDPDARGSLTSDPEFNRNLAALA